MVLLGYEAIVAIIILIREILISGLREFLAKYRFHVPVTSLAKFKTFLQMFALQFYSLVKAETIFNFWRL